MKTINWENYSWKYLSLIGDEQVISLQRTKVYVFSASVLCLGKIHENPQSNAAWEQRLEWFKSSPEYRILDRIDGEPMEIRVEYLPRIQYVAAQSRGPRRLRLRIGETPEKFHRKDLSSCRCSMTSHGDQKTTRESAIQMLNTFLYMQKRFGAGQWSFLGPGSEKKW